MDISEKLDSNVKLIKQGAEAKIYTCRYLGRPAIVKERFKKNYRHPDLDYNLTKERMKAEARAIVRCKAAGILTPTLFLTDFTRRRIYMEFYDRSITVKDFIINVIQPDLLTLNENDPCLGKERRDCLNRVAFKIGQTVGKMHKNNIIHGDLTTSNILLVDGKTSSDNNLSQIEDFKYAELVMIDFGLAHIVSCTEDKGVDLYVLERAIISTHNDVPELFNIVFEGYKKEMRSSVKEVVKKFEEVRARGRKRTMVG